MAPRRLTRFLVLHARRRSVRPESAVPIGLLLFVFLGSLCLPHELGSSHSVRRFDLVGFDLKRPESSPRRPLHSYRTALVRPVFLAKDFQYRIQVLVFIAALGFSCRCSLTAGPARFCFTAAICKFLPSGAQAN
jgi:hypothetical protein